MDESVERKDAARPEAVGAITVPPDGRAFVEGSQEAEAEVYVASQWKLVWWRFRKHRLAMVGSAVVAVFYLAALFCEFLSPSVQDAYDSKYLYAFPQQVQLVSERGLDLHTYDYTSTLNPETLQRTFKTDYSKPIPLGFFIQGEPYKLWGLIPWDRHLFGAVRKGDRFYPLGADRQGRDLLTRILYGARVSLSIGLVGVAVSFLLGILLGGISGYYGGGVDTVIQRVTEFFMALPTLPLWLGLSAALPSGWSPIQIYFGITIILSFIGWTHLARVVRGRFLQLRTEDFVLAAELDGSSRPRIIFRHMLPSFSSHIIASLTLAIPGMILGETALSFLGLGLQPPVVSWGVLLQDAQNIRTVATAPWLLLPGVGVAIAVLALNFMGDGLRDSADPYAN